VGRCENPENQLGPEQHRLFSRGFRRAQISRPALLRIAATPRLIAALRVHATEGRRYNAAYG